MSIRWLGSAYTSREEKPYAYIPVYSLPVQNKLLQKLISPKKPLPYGTGYPYSSHGPIPQSKKTQKIDQFQTLLFCGCNCTNYKNTNKKTVFYDPKCVS